MSNFILVIYNKNELNIAIFSSFSVKIFVKTHPNGFKYIVITVNYEFFGAIKRAKKGKCGKITMVNIKIIMIMESKDIKTEQFLWYDNVSKDFLEQTLLVIAVLKDKLASNKPHSLIVLNNTYFPNVSPEKLFDILDIIDEHCKLVMLNKVVGLMKKTLEVANVPAEETVNKIISNIGYNLQLKDFENTILLEVKDSQKETLTNLETLEVLIKTKLKKFEFPVVKITYDSNTHLIKTHNATTTIRGFKADVLTILLKSADRKDRKLYFDMSFSKLSGESTKALSEEKSFTGKVKRACIGINDTLSSKFHINDFLLIRRDFVQINPIYN